MKNILVFIINSFHKNFVSTKIRNIIFLYKFKIKIRISNCIKLKLDKAIVLYIDKLLIYKIL